MSATNGNISGGCAKGSLPSSKQRSPESLALLDRCLEEGNELLAPPLEKSPVEDDVNRDVNDLGDDIDNKSLGSIDFCEEITTHVSTIRYTFVSIIYVFVALT